MGFLPRDIHGRLWIAALLAIFALVLAAFPLRAQAQTADLPQPATLTAVAAVSSSQVSSGLVFNFTPSAPKFSIIQNDSNRCSVAFALTSPIPGIKPPSDAHGYLKSVGFEQHDSVLVVTFATTSAAHLTVGTVGDKGLSITLAPPPVPTNAGEAAPSGVLPKAVSRLPEEDGFEVVPLKYADVSEVVGLLTAGMTVKSNDNFTPREPAFGSAGMGGSYSFNPVPPPGLESQHQPLAQSLDDTIGIDRRLNAIILRGSPARIESLKSKIAKIDVPVESVILETIFVELTESAAQQVGLDMNNANGQIAFGTSVTGSFLPSSVGTLYSGIALNSYALQAAIYAQVMSGHGRIVSKPRISAQSGSTAKIITGDALPILTAITLSGVNAVSQQVQYVNVGVTLQIAPRVSSDGFVSSHVFCVVSSVTGYSQGYPTISQREAETAATVHDGETFIIGGLTQENDLSSNSRIPGLGDIPVLGQLFQLRKGTKSTTQLYIVVTPHIVRRGEQQKPIPTS